MSTLNEQVTNALSNKGYQEEDEQPAITFIALWDVFEDLRTKLGKDYRFIPDPDGKFTGFSVYFRADKLPVEGLDTPDNFTYWAKLKHSDESNYNAFTRRVTTILEAMGREDPKNKTYITKLGALFNSLIGRINDTKSELFSQAQARIDKEITFRSITGMSECEKVIPMAGWFSPKLQTLDARKLLSIFPDAEAEILMLIIGRALVGASGTKTREGLIQHTARAYGIMVDQQGGLGKSTLMDYVRSVMTKLGFSVVAMNINMSKYGWATIAKSDLALIDDLENNKLKDIITSAQIKSLVTNGSIRVEEKCIAACEIRGVTTVLGATNTTDPRHFFEMDGGGMSRLNQLQAKSISELSEEYGDYKNAAIKEYWEELGKEYSCSNETFTAYLLARSVEKFLDNIGATIVDGNIVYGESLLQSRMEELRSNLRISCNMTYTDDFLAAIGNYEAFKLSELKKLGKLNDDQAKAKLRALRISPELVLEFIRSYNLEYPLAPEVAAKVHPSTLDARSVKYAITKLPELDNQKQTNSYARSFENVMNELLSTQGFHFPKQLSFYDNKWQRATDGCYKAYLAFCEM